MNIKCKRWVRVYMRDPDINRVVYSKNYRPALLEWIISGVSYKEGTRFMKKFSERGG